MDRKVNVIGPGNVGQTMMGCLDRAGWQIGDVAGRTLDGARAAVARMGIGEARDIRDMRDAALWLLTVPDGAIGETAERLAGCGRAPATALHFSGYHSAARLAALRDAGWSVGSLHPNLSFADPLSAMSRFVGTYCGIEGDAKARDVMRGLVTEIGGIAFEIQPDAKALYHGAAVISNNFTTVLQALARETWAAAGVPQEVAAHLNKSLLEAAATNVAALGPRAALTGPAARGDDAVVAAQAAALGEWRGDVALLYETLSAMAGTLKAHGTTDGADGPSAD